MGLFFKYRIQMLPVVKGNSIQGKICKSSLVSCLRKSNQFSRSVVQLIENLLEPADKNLLGDLRDKINSGKINGFPLISVSGKVQRVITPGVIKLEEAGRDYLESSAKISLFEKLLEEFPFPIKLEKNGETIYSNDRINRLPEKENSGWATIEYNEDPFTVKVFMPRLVKKLKTTLKAAEDGEPFEIKKLLTEIEGSLLETAHDRGGSVATAAKLVCLPRQTFNYRLKKYQNTEED